MIEIPFFGGQTIDLLTLALSLFVIFCFVSALRMHLNRKNPFDILDLLMENGRISKASVVMMGAFALTSWILLSLTLKDKLTEGYLGIYVGAWIAPIVVRLLTNGGAQTSHDETKPPLEVK